MTTRFCRTPGTGIWSACRASDRPVSGTSNRCAPAHRGVS